LEGLLPLSTATEGCPATGELHPLLPGRRITLDSPCLQVIPKFDGAIGKTNERRVEIRATVDLESEEDGRLAQLVCSEFDETAANGTLI